MDQIKVFLDSDVVIAAFLSSTGASFEIINNPKIRKIISTTVKTEIEEVTRRLNIDLSKTKLLSQIHIQSTTIRKEKLISLYSQYVLDLEDTKVIAGAHKTKSQFLLTHNLRHYLASKIQDDLGIIVMKPGIFLQYLRSR